MIKISVENKKSCCGCWACVNSCPRSCIEMSEDKEGFLYPSVDVNVCIDCGLCEKVCPVLKTKEKRHPLKVLAVKNKNKEIVLKSSSGGVFYHFAKMVIEEGGVVFGARFDEEWNVIHDFTVNIDGISAFMTSKYVQSKIGNSYIKAKEFLKLGRKVLFTGTPCQIGGLYNYLHKSYDNLLTMDFLCHGVPSPKVWRLYLNEEVCAFQSTRRVVGRNTVLSTLKAMPLLMGINFRDKTESWQKFRFALRFAEPLCEGKRNSVLLSSSHRENIYMKGFLQDLYLRPSCYECKFKRFQSQSDITVADYWSIGRVNKAFYDEMGVSMVFINSRAGFNCMDSSVFDFVETTFEDTLSNKGLEEFVEENKNRKRFFAKLDTTSSVKALIGKYVEPSLIEKIFKKVLMKTKRLLK